MVEDANVGGVDVGIAGVDRGQDVERLPDRPQLPDGADQEVEDAESVPCSEESADARGRVESGLDGDGDRLDLPAIGR